MRKAPHISLLLLCTLLATCVASMAAGTRGLSRHLTQQEGSRKGEQGEQPAGFHPPKFDSDSVSTAQGGNVSLDRVQLPIPAYDFSGYLANLNRSTPRGERVAAMIELLQAYKVPAATIGIQSDTFNRSINYDKPTTLKSDLQDWEMLGFNMDYKTPMRVAGVSMALTKSVWMNSAPLRARLDQPFWTLWRQNVSRSLPSPWDNRIRKITVNMLLNHTSGFEDSQLDNRRDKGFDPAYEGVPIDAQINDIIAWTWLLGAAGTRYYYSNFGYMIAARLAEGIMGRPWISLVRSLFPPGAPVFAASDTVPVRSNARGIGNPGASEPSLYYVNPVQASEEFAPKTWIDAEFDVTPMAGSGNIVSNVATLSWFGSQYWVGGPNDGRRFNTRQPTTGLGKLPHKGAMTGSMPGTIAVLAQYVTKARRASSFCVIINTRPDNADEFVQSLTTLSHAYLETVFP